MTKFAWPSYQDPWECIVTSVDLDGAAGSLEINGDHLRVDAFDDSWRAAELTVEATTDEPPPRGLEDPRAYVLVTCSATQLRRSYPLIPIDEQLWAGFKGTVALPRTALSGKALLTIEVVAKYEGRTRVVGSSIPWALVVDKSEASRTARYSTPAYGVGRLRRSRCADRSATIRCESRVRRRRRHTAGAVSEQGNRRATAAHFVEQRKTRTPASPRHARSFHRPLCRQRSFSCCR